MKDTIIRFLQEHFQPEDLDDAIKVLSTLTIDHVMGFSEINLINAQKAVILLAEGNLSQLEYYTEKAKIDFRDVIYWAQLASK